MIFYIFWYFKYQHFFKKLKKNYTYYLKKYIYNNKMAKNKLNGYTYGSNMSNPFNEDYIDLNPTRLQEQTVLIMKT